MPNDFNSIKSKNPGMEFNIFFLTMFIVNGAVIGLANMFFPSNVVLGTMSLSYGWALIISSLILSLIVMLALPFIVQLELNRKKDLNPGEMMAAYFIINFVSIWLITRAAEIFGLGVSSWYVVLALAFVLDMVQGLAITNIQKLRGN